MMNSKEHWLAVLNGEHIDRPLFWPKIFDSSYAAQQAPPFSPMSVRELHDYTGTDMLCYLPGILAAEYRGCSYRQYEQDHCSYQEYTINGHTMQGIRQYDPRTNSYHPLKMAVETRDDLLYMGEFYRKTHIFVDDGLLEAAEEAHVRLDCRGATVSNIGESPLMDFLEWHAGIQNGQFLLFDFPDESGELLAAMQALCMEKTRLYAARSPADVLLFTENTSTTILSPEQFRRYCMGHLSEYCDVATQYERRLLFHMCGHLKALLPDLAALDCTGFEAFTSPPVGDALFSDARAVFQRQCLIGGTNCLTWTKPAAEIIAELERVLPMMRSHPGLILSTGGIIPPSCTPETVKKVAKWIYSQRL